MPDIDARKTIARDALARGASVAEAARMASLNRQTVFKLRDEGKTNANSRLTRDDALDHLGALVKASPVQYKAALLRLIADMERWTKQDSDSRGRSLSIASLLDSWRAERDRDAGDDDRPTPATEGEAPPSETENEVLTPPHPPANFEKGDSGDGDDHSGS